MSHLAQLLLIKKEEKLYIYVYNNLDYRETRTRVNLKPAATFEFLYFDFIAGLTNERIFHIPRSTYYWAADFYANSYSL